MPTLVLVDGSSYLYRAFHALPDLRTSQGEPTGALRGVLSMLRRMVEDEQAGLLRRRVRRAGQDVPRRLVSAIQGEARRRCRTISRAQIEPLHELVRAHGWPLLMVEGVEADDVIGTLAARRRRPASTA